MSVGASGHDGRVRHTEFWDRMDHALGHASARSWASLTGIAGLGGRTAQEALDAGVAPKEVWAEVHRFLGLPATLK